MKNLILLSILSITFLFSSCTNDNIIVNNPQDTFQKIKIAEGYSAGTKIELYVNDTLRSGYNQLYIRLLDSVSLSAIRYARIELIPMMDMGASKHSCPTEQAPSGQITDDYFQAAVIFTMAETNTHKWSITINFHNDINGKESEISFPVSVIQGSFPPGSFSTPDGNSVIVAMLPIAKPKVGMNDAEFIIYNSTAGVFTPLDDVTTVITPEMPSMGHGSPNNVNPVSKGKGHYTGKINFSMTGEWKINLNVSRGNELLGKPFFWITL